jgi:hypothetical protein
MKNKSTRELEAQRSVLLRQLRKAGPTVEGSIAMPARKCGSPTCECARGVTKHRAMILCKKVNGKSVATYVPKDMWEKVRKWNREHKKIKRILKQISDIDEQIIRNYVTDKRREKKVRKSLKVLPKD